MVGVYEQLCQSRPRFGISFPLHVFSRTLIYFVESKCLTSGSKFPFILRPGDDSKFTFDQAQQSDPFDEPSSAILRVNSFGFLVWYEGFIGIYNSGN